MSRAPSVVAAGAVAMALSLLVACTGGSSPGTAAGDRSDGSTSSAVSRSEGSGSAAGAELFDASVVHSIDVRFDEDDYDAMIATFQEQDAKEWIEATVTIDGVTYEHVGLRLKGNSSLMGLRGGGRSGPGGSGSADADAPASLPWLIRFDKFVDGQLHQGHADVVVRSNNSSTALNEAVALDLLDAAGLASQRAMATSFSINGSDPVLRLAIEHPDDDAWQDSAFDGKGALYKAESTGDWSYRGDDPESYTDVFDQEGGKKVADLTPLIEFLQFVNESDDAAFAAELAEHLDVESFARYLAMMELVENFDDIDGPGNNAYLWWDAASERFTVVPWDMNLAFGQMGGPGGGGGRRGDVGGAGPEDMQPPEGFEPGRAAGGMRPPAGGEVRGMGGGRNVLVQRFHANAEFEAIYTAQLETLRAELFASGDAVAALDSWVEALGSASHLIEADVVTQEADALRGRLESIAGG